MIYVRKYNTFSNSQAESNSWSLLLVFSLHIQVTNDIFATEDGFLIKHGALLDRVD
jgi:hypothetical protein